MLLLLLIGASLVGGKPARAAGPDRILTNDEKFPNGFEVPAGETWSFDPAASTTVTVSGNVVVRGRLEMKPASRDVQHRLRFTGIDESSFLGSQGTSDVPAGTDIGLWVLGAGALDIQGTPKLAWAYTYQSDWAGDEVRATPVNRGNYTGFPTVASTPAPNALGYRPELLNLTRNVTIEGTPSGRTHIFITSSQKQTIRYATIRHVAPDLGTDITGRYGLHFHQNKHASSGSMVEGVVIRDAGNHAFVPHASHGITFRNTIAYNTVGDAYWWDPSKKKFCGSVEGCNASHDTLYDGIVAALTHTSPYQKTTSASIQLGEGNNNTIINSVAVGMQGEGQNNSGFKWPSAEDGIWKFENNVAHNNDSNGIFVWQNTGKTHVVNGFVAYYNAKVGVDHGAYTNPYIYQNLMLLDNERGAIDSHAQGVPSRDGKTDTQRWENVKTGGRGVLVIQGHVELAGVPPPVRFTHCDFPLVVFNELGKDDKSTADPGYYDFVECGLKVGDFDLTGAANKTVIRVQDGASAYRLTGDGTVTSIPPFFTVNPPLPPPPGSGPFVDISDSVFAADIIWLYETGITRGCNPPVNDRFCPANPVARGQMAAFLDRALDLPGARDRFVDDENSVFQENINALAAAGITHGCNPPENDKFCPGDHVTRGQMAAFLVRALALPPGPDRFKDDADSVFEADINALAAAGITQGCNPPANDLFCPNHEVTRGQMAAFLHRAERFLP